MKTVLLTAGSRGHANHGWLDTYHTFSFAGYYDPNRIHFGALRVLNDDFVEPGEGFGTHPHDNMEIVSIPLFGEMEHKDSMGHTQGIKAGDVQVMSAGSGITHSEYNASKDKPLNFFQIWVFSNKQNVEPRYDQKTFDFFTKKNELVQIVSPDPKEGLWLHQDAWFNMGTFEKGTEIDYKVKKSGNGVYVMVIDGEFSIGDQELRPRDGYGIWDTDSIKIKTNSDQGRILLIDVPMKFD